MIPLPGSWASGRLKPFAAFTRLISAIPSLHGRPAAHHHAAVTPYPHRSPTVAPLIGDKRCYGAVTQESGRGCGGRLSQETSLFAESGFIRGHLAAGSIVGACRRLPGEAQVWPNTWLLRDNQGIVTGTVLSGAHLGSATVPVCAGWARHCAPQLCANRPTLAGSRQSCHAPSDAPCHVSPLEVILPRRARSPASLALSQGRG